MCGVKQALQVIPGQRVSLQLEQAYALMLAGNISDAYDTLAVILTGAADSGSQFMAEAFCGLIRHTQWADAVRSAQSQAQQSPGTCTLCYSAMEAGRGITDVHFF